MERSNFNTKVVFNILGGLLLLESFFMATAALISLFYQESDIVSFLYSIGITLGSALLLRFLGRGYSSNMFKREAFLVVTLTWVLFSLFGMLPFWIGGFIPSFTDAYFETISGFTTTGASILNDIEALPHGLLFWRSLIQWLGGMGIIVFYLALLPKLGGFAGVNLFNSESSGLTHEKLQPRIHQTAMRLWGVYLGLTLILICLLVIGPMDLFDSVCHSFTAMATGGYSTKQASIAYWNSPYTEYVLSIFMMISAVNYGLVYFFAKGQFKKLYLDEEFRWYAGVILFAVVLCAGMLMLKGIEVDPERAFRLSLFQVSSLMTTTGYATADYVAWGSFFSFLMLSLMLLGGSAGSTAGGIKVIRLVVMVKNLINEFKKRIHPNAVLPVRVNQQILGADLIAKVLAFVFMYIIILFFASLILTGLGSTLEEALGAIATCINGVGPGLGSNGPAGNFYLLHPVSKWTLSFIMLVGRLELFTVFILFSPSFWKK